MAIRYRNMYADAVFRSLNRQLSPGRLYHGPQWLVLGVNNVCNLHCKMCDVGTGNTQTNFAQNLVGSHPLNMPVELVRKITDQAALYFPKTKLGYAFTEPLIYPHLTESLAYARYKKLYTSITTNALVLPKKAEELCKAGLNDIFISLDGPEETHNLIRGNKQSFGKAAEGIEKLLSFQKRPDISVFCVITEWNTGQLKSFADHFSKYPLKQIGFMHMNFTPQHVADLHNQSYGNTYPATPSNMDEINIGNLDLDILWEEIQQVLGSDYPFSVSFSPSISSKAALKRFYHHPEQFFGRQCHDVFNNIMIKTDGSVIPAHGRCYNLRIGSLYEENLRTIWNSEAISRFRKTISQAGGLLPACSRCCSAFN